MKHNRTDFPRDDSFFRWDDLAVAAILIGVILASHLGWIQ